MKKDYYEILGVSKNATTDEIKRAYRKLAHQHHPDKAGFSSESKFKEINEAYQILSNPQKREQYDRFGTTGDFNGFNWQGRQSSDGWDFGGFSGGFNFSGVGDIFETIFGQAFSQVQSEISISLTQALLGDKIKLQTSSKEEIELNIPPGTQDGTTFRFRGKGQPFRNGRGDLLVSVRVNIPRKLSQKQKEILENLREAGL